MNRLNAKAKLQKLQNNNAERVTRLIVLSFANDAVFMPFLARMSQHYSWGSARRAAFLEDKVCEQARLKELGDSG